MSELAARLEGRWENTLAPEHNLGIDRAVVSVVAEREIEVSLSILGMDGPATWGPVRCEVFECWEEDRVLGAAALGVIELEDLSVELQLRVNKGIIVRDELDAISCAWAQRLGRA